MNRLLPLVFLGVVLAGCATVPPGIESETKYYSFSKDRVFEASKAAFEEVGALILKIEGDTMIAGVSPTNWYRIEVQVSGDSTQTTVFINDGPSGDPAAKSYYNEFWKALEGRL